MNSKDVFTSRQDYLESAHMPAGRLKTLQAAIVLFSRQGYHGTSTAQIASQAGISQATIFKYFKTKEDLLVAILELALPDAKADFLTPLLKMIDLSEVVHYIVHDRFAFLKVNADLIKIVIQEILTDSRIKTLMLQQFSELILKLKDYLFILKKHNPSLNQELEVGEFLRIFIGPILVYFAQSYLLEILVNDEKKDLELIEKQVFKLLTC